MRSATILASGLLTLTRAYTPPKGDPTWGAITLPDTSHPVTRGENFNITWDPNYGGVQRDVDVFVSLVLCRGPPTDCKRSSTAIVEGVPAKQTYYSWLVPCELAAGEQSTDNGNGLLIIVDETGEYQYSMQFSVLAGTTCPA